MYYHTHFIRNKLQHVDSIGGIIEILAIITKRN